MNSKRKVVSREAEAIDEPSSSRNLVESPENAPSLVVGAEEVVDNEESDLKPPILQREEPSQSEDSAPNSAATENVIDIQPEDLAEAGLSIDQIHSLTTEQVTILMEIAERRAQREVAQEQTVVEVEEEVLPGQNDAITIVLTDDGGLKVKDAVNQVFFFPAEQLTAMNIDVNNLTTENISQIVNEAMPAIQLTEKDQEVNEEEVNAAPVYEEEVPGTSSQKQEAELTHLLGERIDIRRNNGKTTRVTVRFVKPGGAIKVQFDDGHFEWVTESQIVARRRSPTDHEGYHNGSTISTRVVHSSSVVNALKRVATGGGSTPPKRINLEPNFCCPICDNKVHQKEPAYIVIRIPACDSCTKEKIIVLDDDREGDVL